MRVVLLTRWSPWQIQAANVLHEKIGLDAVVVETYGNVKHVTNPSPVRRVGRIFRQFRRNWQYRVNTLGSSVGLPAVVPESPESPGARRVYEKLSGHPYNALAVHGAAVEFVGPNGISESLVSRLKPDILIVYGTSILPASVIESAGITALNLHWGLSPWHRGTHCTDWALLKGDVSNIGVTVHVLDPGIDSGPIVCQSRPTLDTRDSPFTIDMKLGMLGVDLMSEVVQRLLDGQALVVRPQVATSGTLYLMKHWTRERATQLRTSLDRGQIRKILTDPSRPVSIPQATVTLHTIAVGQPGERIVNGDPFPFPQNPVKRS